MTLHYIIALISALCSIGLLTIIKLCYKKSNLGILTGYKSIAIVFAVLFLSAYIAGNDAIASVFNLGSLENVKIGTLSAFILVWFSVASGIFLSLFPFFKNSCREANVLVFFPALVFIADFIFLGDFIGAQTGKPLSDTSIRSILLTLEVGVGLGYSLFATIDFFKDMRVEKKYIKWLILALLCMIIASAPNYTLQLLFNPADYAFAVDDLNMWHRIFIYPMVVIPIVIYLVLAGKKVETCRYVLLYYALAGLWNFMCSQKIGMIWGKANVSRLPFHLCNIALYITALCLTFKLKKLFYFTYFINVFGAFIAIAMPNYTVNGLNGTVMMTDTLHFFREHYQAFFMPFLSVGLGVFERPKLKQFTWSMIGFLCYYVLMLILNGWFTNYNPKVDYFFINSDFVADKLGTFVKATRNITIRFNIGELSFCYYPIYQILFFFVYCLLALAMWFIYEVAYRSIEGWKDLAIRRKKIKMDTLAMQASCPHNGGEPMNTTAETLSIQGFSKRYGKSDVYAAKDVYLEVKGGEIFGFLGPNGAGKSTIIKSIVGIQPITEGQIFVCGYDVEKQSVQSKLNIGFVPDHYALYEKLTAREYVNYIADLYGVPKSDRDERINKYIGIFELETAIDKPISTYSHGMKQKVAIIAALIHNPKVWILDEPLTGLDPNSIYQVKECMKQHAKEGNVVFFSSHLIDVVERICDKIAIIRKGQIQCVREVSEIEKETSLEEFYMNIINSSEVKPVPYGKVVTE